MMHRIIGRKPEAQHYVVWGMLLFVALLLGSFLIVPPRTSYTGQAILETNKLRPAPLACGCTDVNGDGIVNIVDRNEVILAWGWCQGNLLYDRHLDVNGNGCTDAEDISCIEQSAIRTSGCS